MFSRCQTCNMSANTWRGLELPRPGKLYVFAVVSELSRFDGCAPRCSVTVAHARLSCLDPATLGTLLGKGVALLTYYSSVAASQLRGKSAPDLRKICRASIMKSARGSSSSRQRSARPWLAAPRGDILHDSATIDTSFVGAPNPIHLFPLVLVQCVGNIMRGVQKSVGARQYEGTGR